MAHSRPIRGYSKYLVNPQGHVFHADTKKKKEPQFYNGKVRYFLTPDVQGRVDKLTPPQCILLAYFPDYELGDTIRFRDGDKNNHHINNLHYKKVSVILTFDSRDEILGKKIWRVSGKARSASERTDCGGNLTADEVYRCLLVAQFKCYYCGEDLVPTNWQLDHALPVCQGGNNEFKNLRAACRNCNMMKGSMTISQFKERVNILYERFKELG